MNLEERTVEVMRGFNQWQEINFKHLHEGDNFRLFEPNGDSVVNEKNEVIFYATSNPYFNEDFEVWMINTE
jgi:hypothetical protein